MNIAEANLHRHLTRVVGPRDPVTSFDRLEEVGEYIADQFRRLGLEVSEERFRVEARFFRNVIGTLPGTSKEEILVVAHYDAVEGTPGADDNASGVAGLLEIGRALAQSRFRRTITLLATTLEECGYQGSLHHVREALRTRRPIRGVLDLEMIGYVGETQMAPPGVPAPPVGNFIGVVGNSPSAFLVETFREASRRFVPDLPVETLIIGGNGEELPMVRLSDHAPFWDAGFPAVMITDTSFLRNPHYHERSDTLETLNLPFLRKVAIATTYTAALLAERI
jgi:Zn-dependent M28 family amino/carboxypeptidase